MDKTALKNFAMYSREKLIEDIKSKAILVGITEEGINDPLPQSTNDMNVFDIGEIETHKIYGEDVKRYGKLIKELEKREVESDYKTAYKTLVEEIAYTWFNRIIAIRFMEVNNYMPDKIRVLSSGKEGVREPEFITYYRDTDIGITEEEFKKLDELKLDGSSKAMEKLFQFMFIKQCNALNKNLPELFEKTDDYAELLLNISYNDPEGVVYKLIENIGEGPFNIEETGQIEIIGWLYQYYNEVPRDQVINIYKGNVKKEDIPAATQLFTTQWVVKYMVENSLGKYWLERNPDSKLKEHMKYLMPGDIEHVDEKVSPEDIKVFDNAMGSGHILIYAFDILMKIYLEEGYMEREAAESIIENNLYGLDIDKRAYQLAYFALMMKGRQYSRRLLNKNIENNLRVFEDSTDIDEDHLNYMGISMSKGEKNKAIKDIKYLIKEFENAKEIGSILRLEGLDIEFLRKFVEDTETEGQISFGDTNIEKTKDKLNNILDIVQMLNNKYEIMITNPPYLNKMSSKLKKYIGDNYPDYKKDLFSVFIYNNVEMCKEGGYSAYMTPFVWMFISTYEKLRQYILTNKHISSLIQMEYSAFEEATVPICTVVLQNEKSDKKGKYIRLSDFKGGMEVQRIKTLEAIENPDCGYYYETNQDNFELIPEYKISYWLPDSIYRIFDNKKISNYGDAKVGIGTGNTEYFLRLWYEVDINNVDLNAKYGQISIFKWLPINKGGKLRKWYGNNENLINWENDGLEAKNYSDDKGKRLSYPRNLQYQLRESLTWGDITNKGFSMRYSSEGFLFSDVGNSLFLNNRNDTNYILGYCNSKVFLKLTKILNPTIHFKPGNMLMAPIKLSKNYKPEIDSLVQQNISISKTDWDSFETSWDFKIHPLLDKDKQGQVPNTIESAYENWKEYANNNFTKLKENEERLNELFIEIYGLEDELTPEVSDKDITIAKIFDDKKDIYEDIKGNQYILTKKDVIKSFISYGVGCIFGRYSLDEDGLVYAGGEFDMDRYKKFKPVEDNVVVITDKEYFEDDLVNRFVKFVKVSFGEESLEENLEFIADALGGKGTPREIVRNYFLKDFYKEHVKTYQKRPIYWLYDSRKQNGFKALIYMHRYDEDTTGKVRIDYLHKVQRVYENRIDYLRDDIANNKDAKEIARSEKELEKIMKQLKECKDYDEKIGHIAVSRKGIDLDDGVKVNYDKVQTDDKGKKYKILAKI